MLSSPAICNPKYNAPPAIKIPNPIPIASILLIIAPIIDYSPQLGKGKS
jgi:hypothetical protein